jgi:hypothetical protein
MMMRRHIACATLVGSLVLGAIAWADPPCMADIQKLCANVPGTADQIQACLKSHETELSKECKAHVEGLRKSIGNLAATCIWDIERFCPNTRPGGARIAECLKKNLDSLSPTCKDRFND